MKHQLFTQSEFRANRWHRLMALMLWLLMAALSQPVAAQEEIDQTKLGIRGGLIFGMDASQVDGDDYAGYHKVGFNTGFYGQIPVSKMFFFSVEILYAQDGGKAPVIPGQVLRYRSQFGYAQVPILFHFQEKEAVNFGAGFLYGRLVGQRIFADEIEQPDPITCTGKPDDTSLLDPQFICTKKNDFRAVADANYLFTDNFMINVRFSYSIVPFGYYGSSNFINRGLYHNVLTFRLMYVF
ncbi:MAG: PorT family protein [Chitinophagales bacterium]|nr:PorT family protein [Chitinophagales bacterium]